ncbi:MAG TPA: IclR family transcriptional regulator [Alphaproteobacteria bacterium]|nr:IclR family transcriptional regulator [Alphaproteobacteria bacterium]
MIESTTVPEARAQQGVRSVEIGMALLQALAARARSPLSLSDIAADAGMAPAKAHRYLVSLIRAGMVEQDQAAGRYRLGGTALNIGLAALSALDVMRLAGEALTALRDAIDETVLLAVWGNKGPVVVRWEEASRPVTTNVRAGSVMPLLNSSTGRVFAAFLPEATSREMIADEAAQTPALAKGYTAVLEETRARRMGRVEGDLLPGVAGLSAPVFDHQGDLVAVMSALGAQGQFDADWGGAVAAAIKAATQALSRRLGYRVGE